MKRTILVSLVLGVFLLRGRFQQSYQESYRPSSQPTDSCEKWGSSTSAFCKDKFGEHQREKSFCVGSTIVWGL